MVESRQDEVLAIIGVFTVVAFLFVTTRIYSRYLGRNFAWDDYLIMGAILLQLVDTIATWKYILLSGTGYHMRDLPKKSVNKQLVALRWNFSVQMLYHPLMGLIRASIIMFLFRMKDNRRRIRYSLHVVFWLNIMYCVGTSLGNILQCEPIRYTWSKPAMDSIDANGHTTSGGACFNSRTFILTSCALSIFMDLIIIPIPSIMVWNLQMSIRTKVLVVIVMSLGWIATGVSVGRFIVYYYRFAPTNTDRTWDIGIAISVAEPAVHIMTACAPATKCLFRNLFPSFITDRTPRRYAARQATLNTPGASTFGSRTSKSLGAFRFGLSSNDQDRKTGHELREEASNSDFKDNSMYEMKQVETEVLQEGETGMVDQSSVRISCTKTGGTDLSEPIAVEPVHCLGHAR